MRPRRSSRTPPHDTAYTVLEKHIGTGLGQKDHFCGCAHPERVDFGSGQGRSDFETTDVAHLLRGINKKREQRSRLKDAFLGQTLNNVHPQLW